MVSEEDEKDVEADAQWRLQSMDWWIALKLSDEQFNGGDLNGGDGRCFSVHGEWVLQRQERRKKVGWSVLRW